MVRPFELDVDIYLRKSRKDIEEEKNAAEHGQTYDTLERHRKRLLEVVKKENHNVIEIHEEVVSGEFISERPEIQKLLRRVESGSTEAVLVVDLDRLGRGDMLDQGLLDRAFRYSGTKIITPTEFYDPSDESWELVFGIKTLVARQELKAITRRMQGGRRQSALEGKSISKKPPYGYLRDSNLKLYPDPDTAWVVKKIFEMMTNGQGRQAITHELDKLGVQTPNKNRNYWDSSTITTIIKNEVYLGHIIWGKINYIKQNGKYKRKKMPRDKWFIKENAHEPIVSQELWESANKAHTSRWRASTNASKSLSNPFAGILKCENCGYTMLYQAKKNRPNDRIYCPQKQCRGIQKGAALNLVEEKIINGLKEIVDSFDLPEIDDKHEKDHSGIKLKEKAVENKEKELNELNTQKNSLHDLLERSIYDIDTFLERQNILSERLKKIQHEIKHLQEEIEDELLIEKRKNEFIPMIKTVLESYHSTDDIEKKNMLLKSVLLKATYLRKKEWKQPDHFLIQLYPHI